MSTNTDPIERGRWYPQMPPALDGEGNEAYTNRLTGADQTGRVPYDHRRFRQCSLGYHAECSDPDGDDCQCPCHVEGLPKPAVRVTRIDLDEGEDPETLYMVLPVVVADRIGADFGPLPDGYDYLRHSGALTVAMPVAADLARYYGRIAHGSEALSDFYYAVAAVANRWWDNGLSEAPTAGLVAQ